MNHEKQTELVKKDNNEQLFNQLESNFKCIEEKIFCAVRTEENIKKLILIILDELRSRNIFISNIRANKWQKINHFNFTFKERLIKVYEKVNEEMIFTTIGTY
jgi:hypothetical protein